MGCTTDLDQRLGQHRAGTFSGYTSARLPIELVWVGEFQVIHDAIAFERKVKRWSRAKKEALIIGDWSRLKALSSRSRSEAITHARLPPIERYGD